MPLLFGKTSHEELAAFLDQHGQHWNVSANPGFMEHVEHTPLETEELIAAIQSYATESAWVYLASDYFPAEEISRFFSLEEARDVKGAQLDAFRVRTVRGSDFLYFFCSPGDVSNGSYVTLLPATVTVDE
jgi:hypothetical protein